MIPVFAQGWQFDCTLASMPVPRSEGDISKAIGVHEFVTLKLKLAFGPLLYNIGSMQTEDLHRLAWWSGVSGLCY